MVFEEVKEADTEMIVLPGGLPGATNLDAHKGLSDLIMPLQKPVNRCLLFVRLRWYMANVVC